MLLLLQTDFKQSFFYFLFIKFQVFQTVFFSFLVLYLKKYFSSIQSFSLVFIYFSSIHKAHF